MLSNIVTFLSSIATVIFLGAVLTALSTKYKNNAKQKQAAGVFANLITTANTQSPTNVYMRVFANLQFAYHNYDQIYSDAVRHLEEAAVLGKKVWLALYAALAVWLGSVLFIFISGGSIGEYLLSTALVVILAFAFFQFSTDSRESIGQLTEVPVMQLPVPDDLLTPTNVLEKCRVAYMNPALPLNLLEVGMAVELLPSERSYWCEGEAEDGQIAAGYYDYSDFCADGRLLFAFPYRFSGRLYFIDKTGAQGEFFPLPGHYIHDDVARSYDMAFSYKMPLHHLSEIRLIVLEGETEYAKVSFIVSGFEDPPPQTVILQEAIASHIKPPPPPDFQDFIVVNELEN